MEHRALGEVGLADFTVGVQRGPGLLHGLIAAEVVDPLEKNAGAKRPPGLSPTTTDAPRSISSSVSAATNAGWVVDGLLRRSAGYQIDLDPDGHAGLYPAEIPADGLQRRPAVVPLIIRARPEPYFRHGGPSPWKILNSVIIPYPAALRKLRPSTLAENMEVRALRTRSKARRRGGDGEE